MHKNCIDMMNFLLYNRYVTNSKGAFLCMRYPQIVKKMSLEQKAAFVSGYDYWHLEEAPELGLPKIMITDGPHGLRKAKGGKERRNRPWKFSSCNLFSAGCYFILLLG